jgi:hypothetical protein
MKVHFQMTKMELAERLREIYPELLEGTIVDDSPWRARRALQNVLPYLKEALTILTAPEEVQP